MSDINKKLMEAMSAMENPTKSSTATVPTKSGKTYTYNYETLESVLDIVRPALQDAGLALTQYMSDGRLYTAVFDIDEEKVLDTRPVPEMTDAQQLGSFETYMRRYALRSVFGLCGEDDDGQAASSPRQTRKANPEGGINKDVQLKLAGAELKKAVQKYADLHGKTYEQIYQGVKKRPDYEDTVEFYQAVTEELESACLT